MMLSTAKTLIEITEFCHKIRSFKDDDGTNSSLNQCHCMNDIFVHKFYVKFNFVFRRMGCKFSPNNNRIRL